MLPSGETDQIRRYKYMKKEWQKIYPDNNNQKKPGMANIIQN